MQSIAHCLSDVKQGMPAVQFAPDPGSGWAFDPLIEEEIERGDTFVAVAAAYEASTWLTHDIVDPGTWTVKGGT